MPLNASTEKPSAPSPTDQKPPETPASTTPPTDQAPQRPEWVPEKFWKDGKVDQEGLAKSYAELEKKASAAPKEEPKPGEKPAETPSPDPATDAAFDPFFKEFEKDGKLSEASYEALTKKGIPKAVVDQYIAGIQATQAAAETRIYEAVGGKEQYDKVATWARENLSAPEIEAYNQSVAGSPEQASLAVQGLFAKFSKAEGSPGKLYGGRNSDAPAGGAFQSWAQVTEAMNNPKYREDEAYRKEVSDRLAISDL